MNKDIMKKILERQYNILTNNHMFELYSNECKEYIRDNNLYVNEVIYDYLYCVLYGLIAFVHYKHVDVGNNIFINMEYNKMTNDLYDDIHNYLSDTWIDVLNEKVVKDEQTINLLNMMI